MKLKTVLTAATALACLTSTLPAGADSAQRITQIRDRWAQLKPNSTANASPYRMPPQLAPNFEPGSLNNAFLQNGLNATNFARFVAGLPADVRLDDNLASQQQCGALLLAHLKKIEHTPRLPEDFPEDLYQPAFKATSSSNLAYGTQTLDGAIQMYMDDSPTGRISEGADISLGHRRWILNPAMTTTAFGFVNGYSTMYSFDRSRQGDLAMDYVAWPAAVAHPLEWFAPHTIWSVTLNPQKYQWLPGRVTVTLTRQSDQQVWKFAPRKSNGYYSVNTQGFGVNNCLMFRPDNLGEIKDGERFEVEITGLKDDGGATTLEYETAFFSLAPKGNRN